MPEPSKAGRDPARESPQDTPGERDNLVASSPESTVALLARAREGDQAALDQVFARAIPLLKRWASGRLPRWAREMVDTDDLVPSPTLWCVPRVAAG